MIAHRSFRAIAALAAATIGLVTSCASGTPVPQCTDRAPSPRPGVADSCFHDRAWESEVTIAIERAVVAAGVQPPVRPEVEFECPRRAAPRYLEGLRSSGEFAPLELLSADAPSEDEVDLRVIVLTPRPEWPKLDTFPPVEFARAVIRGDQARRALGVSRAALAARVALIAPPTAPGAPLRLYGTTSAQSAIALAATTTEEEIARSWIGMESSGAVSERAPIDIAFGALAELPHSPSPPPAKDADRQLFARLWHLSTAHGARWLELQFLDLASVLGSQDVLPDAEGWLLGARSDGERVLAIRALAAITGHATAATDASGRPRSLADLVAEYRGLLHLEP